MDLTLPFRIGFRLGDLVRELERRLIGTGAGPGLDPAISELIPVAESYVFVLFDGLGRHQLAHPAVDSLAEACQATLRAPFPTTTTVSMATVATGREPAEHGMIGHLMWLPELTSVVNVLKWVTPTGERIDHATDSFLPAPNLWERLADAGIEPITVQPGEFAGTPLTRALYRGCRFEGVYSTDEAVKATIDLSRSPGRLVFAYFPQVDFAAHVWGQRSAEYQTSLRVVDDAWSRLVARSSVPVIGTADHGHLDYGEADKVLIRDTVFRELTFYGDPRSVFVRGSHDLIRRLAGTLGVQPIWTGSDPELWPGNRMADLGARLPDAVLPAPGGKVLLPRGFDKRLTGYHGGLAPEEVEIPLLVG